MRFVEVGGGFGLEDQEQWDEIRSVTVVGELPYVFIQVTRVTSDSRSEGREYAGIFSYLLDSRTGEGAYIGDALPPVYAIEGDRIYTAVRVPFPQVRVYEIP